MKFYDYLKKSLNFPLCYLSSVFDLYFQGILYFFDKIVDDSFLLLREFFPKLTTNLENYIEERNIKSIPDESYDILLDRTKNAYSFYKDVTLFKSVKSIIEQITDKSFYIEFPAADSIYVGSSFVGDNIGGEPFIYLLVFQDILSSNEKSFIYNFLREYIKAYVEIIIISPTEYIDFYVGDVYVGEVFI